MNLQEETHLYVFKHYGYWAQYYLSISLYMDPYPRLNVDFMYSCLRWNE